MKILCVIDSLGSGGAQRQLVGLADLLHGHGYEVKVVWYHADSFYKEFLDARGVDYENIVAQKRWGKWKRVCWLQYVRIVTCWECSALQCP